MVDGRGASHKKSRTQSWWLPSPEVSAICVTGVVAMYAHKFHFSFHLPNLPTYHPPLTSLPSNLFASAVAIEAFEYFASSSLHIVAFRQLAEVLVH